MGLSELNLKELHEPVKGIGIRHDTNRTPEELGRKVYGKEFFRWENLYPRVPSLAETSKALIFFPSRGFACD